MTPTKLGTSICRIGLPGHPMEIVPGSDNSYLYAAHDGAWLIVCRAHSGLCHEECWPGTLYPELRPRIAP
jgi:hypothetical protein